MKEKVLCGRMFREVPFFYAKKHENPVFFREKQKKINKRTI
ncbi:hypothetical protein [Ventrimonas faecis]